MTAGLTMTGMNEAKMLVDDLALYVTGPEVLPGARAGAEIALEGLTMRVPVDEGELLSNLEMGKERVSPTRASVEVGVNPGMEREFRWMFLEHGTTEMEAQPFVRPTADEDQADIVLAAITYVLGNLRRAGIL